MNVGFISLGCSKNLIDTEMCIGLFKDNNFNIVNRPEDADIIVVNTCGFIDKAKQEAIDTLLEMASYKEKYRCKYLIAMGCLVQRYKDELIKTIPEVDLFLSISDYDNLWNKISELIDKNNKNNSLLDYNNRIISTGNKMAYLKIAEGCSNNCTYCAIPNIRGPYISRKIEDILEEAEILAKRGIEEIIVIAQDTTKYGLDLYGEYKLPEILRELCKIKEFKWIRFLYAYPESITDELIKTVKEEDKICNYFDIPIQHFSDRVLKRMNRKSDGKSIENTIEKIRKEIPDVILRTSLIVGFPGETEEDFNELCKFVSRIRFDKLGVFEYSKEDGTPASRLKDQIHPMTKKRRYREIMKIQKVVSEEKLKDKIGKEYDVLIEQKTSDGKYYIARSYMDMPDTDGVVFVENTKENLEDSFQKCVITDVSEYDLIGKLK